MRLFKCGSKGYTIKMSKGIVNTPFEMSMYIMYVYMDSYSHKMSYLNKAEYVFPEVKFLNVYLR